MSFIGTVATVLFVLIVVGLIAAFLHGDYTRPKY